jgi:hypothetical protein
MKRKPQQAFAAMLSLCRPEQVETIRVSVAAVMRTKAFQIGVAEVRNGQAPNYDRFVDSTCYERGRQWAVLAPPDLPLLEGNRVHPEAMRIFREMVQL